MSGKKGRPEILRITITVEGERGTVTLIVPRAINYSLNQDVDTPEYSLSPRSGIRNLLVEFTPPPDENGVALFQNYVTKDDPQK